MQSAVASLDEPAAFLHHGKPCIAVIGNQLKPGLPAGCHRIPPPLGHWPGPCPAGDCARSAVFGSQAGDPDSSARPVTVTISPRLSVTPAVSGTGYTVAGAGAGI